MPRLFKIEDVGHTTSQLWDRLSGWWITKSIKPFIVWVHPLLGYYHIIQRGYAVCLKISRIYWYVMQPTIFRWEPLTIPDGEYYYFWVQCMVQGIWPLILWGYSWPDRDVPYGAPILILPYKISSWYNGGFSISRGASFYHCYSTAGSVAVIKRARVKIENVINFWIRKAQRLCYQEGTCSMHIPCVRSQLQLWRVILHWLLTAEGGSCSKI